VTWFDRYRALVADRLRDIFAPLRSPVYALCAYHLGWTDESGRALSGQAGKMLRPVLCLAACRGYGDPALAVHTGAALELLHAFSLAHDDIEDGDRERRHRPTLWALHGVPLALNAGDALYALAVATLHDAVACLPPEAGQPALSIFSSTCLRLVEGQHLDIEFETRAEVGADEYVEMVSGKTGALFGASLALGALCAGAPVDAVEGLRAAGVELGLAFQARDDVLAFWGDPSQTGKAAGNDLARGKKSLPVVLAHDRGLDTRPSDSLVSVLDELQHSGVRDDAERFVAARASTARHIIAGIEMASEGCEQLLSLVDLAVSREG